jgi:hypothetical protein
LLKDSRESMVERLMARLSAAALLEEELPATMLGPEPRVLESALDRLASMPYRQLIEGVVQELSMRGKAVIVGHGSQVVLEGPGILKVLIEGSGLQRAERLALDRYSPLSEAIETVEKLDKLRNQFFQQAYGINWLDPSLYDLVLNTDRIPAEVATQAILTIAQTNDVAKARLSEDKGLRKAA